MAPKKTATTSRKLAKPVRRGKLIRNREPTIGSLPVATLHQIISNTTEYSALPAKLSPKTELKNKQTKKTTAGKRKKAQGKNIEGVVKKLKKAAGDPNGSLTHINGFPIAPKGRLPRVGEWPSIEIPPSKQEPYKPPPTMELIAGRCTLLEALINPKHARYLGDSFRTQQEVNIRAVVKHWRTYKSNKRRDFKLDGDHSFWVDGKKVSRADAMTAGKESWAEPLVSGLGPVYKMGRLVPNTGPHQFNLHELGTNVYEHFRMQEANGDGVQNFKGRLFVWYCDANRVLKANPVIFPGADANELRGMATTLGTLDTGCSTTLLSPLAVRIASMCWDYIGPTGAGLAVNADGVAGFFLYRWFNYCWMHPSEPYLTSESRSGWFSFPPDWETNDNQALCQSLIGLNVMSQDTWVLVRGTPTVQAPANNPGGGVELIDDISWRSFRYQSQMDYPRMWQSASWRNYEDMRNDDPASYQLLR